MADIPALTHDCNSWIAEAPDGSPGYRGSRFVEVFRRADAEVLAGIGWVLRTSGDHLERINAAIANKAKNDG